MSGFNATITEFGDGSLKENTKNNDLDFIRISLLYKNTSFHLLGLLIVCAELIFIISGSMQPQLVWLWSILVFVSLLPRIYLTFLFNSKFKKSEITPANIKKWEILWSASIIFFALSVSFLAYLPIEKDQLIIFLFIGITVTALGIGSIVTTNTSIMAALPFFSCISFPFIIRCYMENEYYYTVLGSIGLIGYLVFTRLLFGLNHITVENIKLQIENKNNSLKDPLTGLWNRRRLYLYIDEVIPQSIRRNIPFCIIILDIDHFKKINDSLGHDAGDKFLIQVSKLIKNIARDEDLVVRYGGEEFMIVMPSADIESAKKLSTRILESLREQSDQTISAGIAAYSAGMDFNTLVMMADEALYQAKESGRNKFVVATSSTVNLAPQKVLPFNRSV